MGSDVYNQFSTYGWNKDNFLKMWKTHGGNVKNFLKMWMVCNINRCFSEVRMEDV